MGNSNGRPIDFTEEVNLTHFKLNRVVGRGAFGKVRIIERRDNHAVYALKYISKAECIKMDAVRNIFRERAMLEELDHPFVCNLRFAFQDDEYMYMIMDLMMGGDLRFHINRKQFDENVIRFWISELSCAIHYLHSKGIVHRDIKPDNVLLDDKGHAHLTDFNIATHLHSHRMLTSHSGTAAYMAPEVFKGNGYDEAVDWWSLGILFYECVYDKRPWEFDNADDLKKAIMRGQVPYPSSNWPVSKECISAIQGLLTPNKDNRLGYGQNWNTLMHHPFFRPISFAHLESKQVEPPFRPSADNINFEATYDLEELLLEEQPLESRARRAAHDRSPRKRKPPKPGNKEQERFEREMQMIEEKFKMFDYTVFERYEGFCDPVRMTVGAPPEWVRPAYEGADTDLLPVKRISTTAPGPSLTEQKAIPPSAGRSSSSGGPPFNPRRRRSLSMPNLLGKDVSRQGGQKGLGEPPSLSKDIQRRSMVNYSYSSRRQSGLVEAGYWETGADTYTKLM